MSFITDIFKGGTSGVLDGVSTIIGKFVEDPTKKAELSQEMQDLIVKHEEAMAGIAEQQYEAQLKDIESARDMQIAALKQDDKFSKRYIYYLATVVVVLVFSFDLCSFFVTYPAANRDMVNQISGVLNTGALIMVLSFFFGSSLGSKNKDVTIAKIATS